MLKHYIEKYVNNMSINDVNQFASKNDVILTNEEAKIIFDTIKSDWETIVFKDHNIVLNKVNLNSDLLSKINDLIIMYKEKYSQLL